MSGFLQQYKAIKENYPNAVLLFRVDDNFESFNEDALTISKHLGLELTTAKNGWVHSQVSFPHYQLDDHLRKLVKAGYRVAVCEELEDLRKRNN
jgi:DNA mismatch repair protein MutS